MAEGAVIFRGRYEGLPTCRWIEGGMREAKFGEDLRLAELIQRLTG
jgi:hypothetical protein